MPEHLHPVLGADPDQELAVAAKVLARRTSSCPSKSPTLLNISPHWLASRLTTLTPSAAPSSSAVCGLRKWTWVSAVTQPRSRQRKALELEGESSVSGVTSTSVRIGAIS